MSLPRLPSPRRLAAALLCLLVVMGLLLSFWYSPAWLQLCAGLALFLFGMQCLEEGLRQLAGGGLEKLLARSTATPAKSLAFGMFGTSLLQSSTLVSLLAIAFISSGLIQLAGGIAIVFGANLGATTGIWLLALAGQNLSLAPLALPLLVLGVAASFVGARARAAGRVVLGIALIFLAIEQIKNGFAAFEGQLDPSLYQWPGLAGHLAFFLLGTLATLVLQSSHATLLLTLTALASGQLQLIQGLSLAIGANLGSSVSTAVVGWFGGNRNGQRLALAHVVFNLVTASVAMALLLPLSWLVRWISEPLGLGDNALIQLALFHTLFNGLGVALFWPLQGRLAQALQRWLPEQPEPHVLITELPSSAPEAPLTRARYLADSALTSVDAAAGAVVRELQHLGRLSLEVIGHALYLPIAELDHAKVDSRLLHSRPEPHAMDAEALYRRHIKGVYGDLLSFMGRLDLPLDEEHQRFWTDCQVAALQLVDAVKDAKHLQKNLGHSLRQDDSPMREAYVELRGQLIGLLHQLRELDSAKLGPQAFEARLQALDDQAAAFDSHFRVRLFAAVRDGRLDGLQTSSLMNDLGYTSRIFQSLRNVLRLGERHARFRELGQPLASEAPLIVLP